MTMVYLFINYFIFEMFSNEIILKKKKKIVIIFC